MRAPGLLGVLFASACLEPLPPPPDAGEVRDAAVPLPEATSNPSRGIDDTALSFDLSARTATAIITFEPSLDAGATLEVGDLVIDTVTLNGQALKLARTDETLTLGLPASSARLPVEIRYRWSHHEGFSGASSAGYTLTWPYFCGNVFPCHATPNDGTTFSLALTGIPSGSTAVFPARIATEAPAYQVAWSIGDYTELPLGRTDAGTELVAWYLPGQAQQIRDGTAVLVPTFEWLEDNLGPYRFGPKAGPVSANWGLVNGGMEHHPYWHMGAPALTNPDTHAHEAAHGWYGDAVRLACWEDFVLSEGTVTYLAARALEAVSPQRGADAWAANTQALAGIDPMAPVWPRGCNAIDILAGLFSRAPYIRGAFFFRAVSLRIGAPALDLALSAFYGAYAGKAATMEELLAVIHTVTGFDPHACAEKWLRSTTIPAVGPCD